MLTPCQWWRDLRTTGNPRAVPKRFNQAGEVENREISTPVLGVLCRTQRPYQVKNQIVTEIETLQNMLQNRYKLWFKNQINN